MIVFERNDIKRCNDVYEIRERRGDKDEKKKKQYYCYGKRERLIR